MAGYTIGSLMLPIEFYVVLAFVALSLFVYCLCFYFSDELHRQYNQGAYFGSLKLSMAATHGVILVLNLDILSFRCQSNMLEIIVKFFFVCFFF